jgi:ferredoxin/flavodoxin---NADP+ reductase
MNKADIYDCIIIGGGPGGLYSAFYAGLRNMKVKLIEAQPVLGGKINLYQEKLIWDVGGFAPVTGRDLIGHLVKQAMTFEPEVVLNEKITSFSKNEEGIFVLEGSSGEVHFSKTIIVAIGAGIITPKKLELDDASRFEASNLHYSVDSIRRFKDKVVMISGGGNSAIDWANLLEPVASKVYLTYRKGAFAGHEAQVSQLENSGVECLMNTTISRLVPVGGEERIGEVELVSSENGSEMSIGVDEVLVTHGFDQDASLFANSKLDIKTLDNFYLKSTPSGETSIPGLYGAGDIVKYDGKVFLIAGAFQDAANAVNRAKKFIEPEAGEMAMVSSNHEAFKQMNRELVFKMVE